MYAKNKETVAEFLHKDITFQRLVRGYYDLNYMEFAVFCALYQLHSASVEDILQKTDRAWQKNKINSALNRLMELGLCIRKKSGTTEGSKRYYYIYIAKSTKDISNEIIAKLEEFVTLSKIELSHIDDHIRAFDTREYKRKKDKRDKVRKEWFDD